MNFRGNAGVYRNNLIGDLTGYPDTTWYDPKGVSDILPMALVEKILPVTYRKGKCFILDKVGGNKRCLIRS